MCPRHQTALSLLPRRVIRCAALPFLPRRPVAASPLFGITTKVLARKQGRRDLNPQPLVLETSALPIELHP